MIPGDHIIRYRPSEYQEKHPYSATHVGIVEINISLIITASEMYIAPRISYTVYQSTSGLVPQTATDHHRMLLNAY